MTRGNLDPLRIPRREASAKRPGARELNKALLRLAQSESFRSGDIAQMLHEITEVAASTLGIDRVGVWFFADDRSRLRCVDLYESAQKRHSFGAELAAKDHPTYFRALERERTIPAHDAHTDPRTREFSHDYLTPHGIASMLDVPIRRAGTMLGVVCHEHVGAPRRWTVLEQYFAASIGDLVSLAMEAGDRRKAQEGLRRRERLFLSLIENTSDMIAIVDRELRVEYLSPSVRKVLGYAPEEFLGASAQENIHPEDLPLILRLHEDAVREPFSVRTTELRMRHKNGSWRYLEAIGQNLLDDEAVGGVVVNLRDITERKELESLLKDYSRSLEIRVAERTRELEKKNQALATALAELKETQNQLIVREKLATLGRMVAGLAHEMNNPVAAVISAADLTDRCLNKILNLSEGSSSVSDLGSEDQFRGLVQVMRDNTRVIAEATERISTLLGNMKNFSRLDEAEFQFADIHEGLESTLALIHHDLKDKATVIRELGRIPRILCYPNQLNLVFLTLLLNAAESVVGTGTIWIRTSADGTHVSVKIADSGRGIPAEHLQRIFEPGFRTKGKRVGVGMGLSIAANIIHNHGGSIHVESHVGTGTEFTIVLPIRQPEEAARG